MNMRRFLTVAVTLFAIFALARPVWAQPTMPQDPRDVLVKVMLALAGKGGLAFRCFPDEKTKPEFGDIYTIIVRIDTMETAIIEELLKLGFHHIAGVGIEGEYWRDFFQDPNDPDDPSPCLRDDYVHKTMGALGYELQESGFYRRAPQQGFVGGISLNYQPVQIAVGAIVFLLVILVGLRVRSGRKVAPVSESGHSHPAHSH